MHTVFNVEHDDSATVGIERISHTNNYKLVETSVLYIRNNEDNCVVAEYGNQTNSKVKFRLTLQLDLRSIHELRIWISEDSTQSYS